MNNVFLKGTKVQEDREIRLSFCCSAKGAPPQYVSPAITKYTGTLATPEWRDLEPGRVFTLSWYPAKSAYSRKDKFETLCYVKADISSAPYTSKPMTTGEMGCVRKYDVILLVGLTELKAQVSWIDSETVRAHLVLHIPIYLIRFPYA